MNNKSDWAGGGGRGGGIKEGGGGGGGRTDAPNRLFMKGVALSLSRRIYSVECLLDLNIMPQQLITCLFLLHSRKFGQNMKPYKLRLLHRVKPFFRNNL